MNRLSNGVTTPIRPVLDDPPDEWDEEVLEDLPEEEQEPVAPSRGVYVNDSYKLRLLGGPEEQKACEVSD